MRVALFTDTYLPEINGVARTLGRWVRFLESKGAECRVFAPTSLEADDPEPYSVERFLSIPFLLYPECRLAIPNPLHLRKTLQEFQPTIIHAATPFNLGLLGMYYANRNRIPFVASYHTHFDQYVNHYKIPWIEPALWRYMQWFHQTCSRIYVPSKSTKDHLDAKGFKRLALWRRGVDTQCFHPAVNRSEVLSQFGIDCRKFVYLFVGRLAPEKSIDVALHAFMELQEDIRTNSCLIIAGDGPSSNTFHEQYGGIEGITFTGFLQGARLAELYAAADAFVFPSATETFGNVILEAMASGTPVIGAAAGGVRDNISHGVTGLLCEPGNVSSFVEAMESLYHSPQMCNFMSSAGIEYAKRQSWEYILEELYMSYEEVIRTSSFGRHYDRIRIAP